MSTGLSFTDEAPSWRRGAGPSVLPAAEVHVWRLRLDPPADRLRLACRQALLALLGRYAGAAPDQVRLVQGRFGKPAVEPGAPGAHIQFNISHSGKVGLIALAAGRHVGVDVEEIRADVHVEDLVRDFFTPTERDSLLGLAREARIPAFYRAWTRREAGIKARGGSITRLGSEDADRGRWHLRDLPMGEGYAAALCVEGDPAAIRLWDES